ncbi:MAG TPA: SGNH/GDSL hydrolase family protein [Flavobacterium sp.]|nr:SGNH/GDSL hydrolase family protein [Flavobacterium sp.]
MKKASALTLFIYCLLLHSCSGENEIQKPVTQTPTGNPPTENPATYKYLALGDSYTIGQSVCETCRFPVQLKIQMEADASSPTVNVSIIATTGWTTTNLIDAINSQNPTSDNDLVTLLIGVNNQYQHKPFSIYETEFPQLTIKAIALAKGDKANVIVVSIPDYAFTPYGQNSGTQATITEQIDQYNAFAENYCIQHNIAFVNITDITREGLTNPNLVTTDGLHPSQIAYARFAERILPKALAAVSQ